MALYRDPRITALAAIAGLLVSFDRQVLQYQRYWWDSVFDFLISWLIHYIAVILVVGVAYAISRSNVRRRKGVGNVFLIALWREMRVSGTILSSSAACQFKH